MADELNMDAVRHSVQDVVYEKDRVFGVNAFFFQPRSDTTYLAAWGQPRREWQLRNYFRSMYNTMFNSVVVNLAKEIASTPWQLYGKRNRDYYHKLLSEAQFGAGWRSFVQSVVIDYCVQDIGACIEIIGRGDPTSSIRGRVEGIGVLDPIYTELTGNVQYPAIYRSAMGGYHRMEMTRFKRITDAPQSDRDFNGRGLSSLSRYMWHTYRQILMGRYTIEKLSDQPPAGFVLTDNIRNYSDAIAQYEADRTRDGTGVWRAPVVMESYEPGKGMKLEWVSFGQLPEQFDYKAYLEDDEKNCARAIGIDFQDVAPLSGGSLGTGTQSKILDTKSKRKTPAILLSEIETLINFDVLPAHLEFKFTNPDAEGEKVEAETAQIWASVAGSVPGMSSEQRLKLVASKVQAVRDVVTDDEGNLDYQDTDTPPPTPETEITAAPAEDTTTEGTDTGDSLPLEDSEQPDMERAWRQKDFQATRLDFESDVANLVNAAVAGKVTRVRFGVAQRALLEKYGRKAMMDGMQAGGVTVSVLEGDDLDTFKAWQREQSLYVSSLGDAIYKEGVQYTGDARGHIWANKSLGDIYNKGLLSADANGIYEWVLGRTKDHCKTCAKNAGQTHRLKIWHRDYCLPKGACLECKGFECDCKIVRRRGRTRGT